MKVLVAQAKGNVLDFLVAMCQEPEDGKITVTRREDQIGHPLQRETSYQSYKYERWSPSRIWAQGGPIIDKMMFNGLQLMQPVVVPTIEHACRASLNNPNAFYFGSTPLIAAMRCYAGSKLGTEVEVLDYILELLK